MEKLTHEVAAILTERFGQDTVIALATQEGDRPSTDYCSKSQGGCLRRLVFCPWGGC